MIYFNHYRHATSILTIDDKRILIDPVFAAKGAYPPIEMTKNPKRNPLIDLPLDYNELMKVDGVLITHNHNDHFDKLAKEKIPGTMPILCQESDIPAYDKLGFTNLTPINGKTNWLGLKWQSFRGTHGGGILYKFLGITSSYLVNNENQKIYITGDTLLTYRVRKLLQKTQPDVIIAFGGGARLKIGGKITMNHKDLLRMSRLLPDSRILAIHMNSINHCFDTKEELKELTGPQHKNIIIPGLQKTAL